MLPVPTSQLLEALSFVERTKDHGVPVRVALKRAERRYGIESIVLRDALRNGSANSGSK